MLDRDTLEKIEEMVKPAIHTDQNGSQYAVGQDEIRQIRSTLDMPETKTLSSLNALVQMVRTEALALYGDNFEICAGEITAQVTCRPNPIYIEAHSRDEVSCFLRPDFKLRYARQKLYTVHAKDLPSWIGGDPIPYEEALIAVRTRFQQTPDKEYLLKLLSDISNGAKITFADNGVATTVITKKGIDLQATEPVKPIVTLAPYRTFQEIEQPASEFHIRISERGIRFIEADGGMWKLKARSTIVEFLREHLSEEVADGRVVMML